MNLKSQNRNRRRVLEKQLRQFCPRIPLADFERVVDLAGAARFSRLPPSIAIWQALGAHIRHVHTGYETLLDEGYDRESARHFILDDMNRQLVEWGCSRSIDETFE